MNKRTSSVALGIAAIACLLVAALGKGWWHAEGITVGLVQTKVFGQVLSNTSLGTGQWIVWGRMTLGAAVLSSVMLLVTSGFVLAGKSMQRGPVSPARLAEVLCVCTSILAVMCFGTAELGGSFTIWFGLPLCITGAALGIASGALAQSLAPAAAVEPQALPPAPSSGIPACPQCAAPTEWRQEYQRHFCHRCSVYV